MPLRRRNVSGRDNPAPPKLSNNEAFAYLASKLVFEAALFHDEYNCACIL